MSSPKVSISLAILCFFLNTIGAEVRIAYQKHLNSSSGSTLFFNPKSYRISDEHHNLTYVLCDDYDDLHKSERNCTVVQDTRSCPVTLQTFNNGTHGADYLEVFPFGSTRAVIVWPDYRVEPRSIKCTILDFTSCKSKDVLLRKNSHSFELVYFVAYDDSFELVINSDAPLANEEANKHDKFHVDAEGNILSELVPWDKPGYKVRGVTDYFVSSDMGYRAIVTDGKPRGYLHFGLAKLLGYSHSPNRITMIKPDGSMTVLKQYYQIFKDLYNKAVSTTYETIGIALPVESRVDISQFDLEGKLKLSTSVSYGSEVEHDSLVYNLALRNLADGGFVLFVVGYEGIIYENPDTCYFTKVDADGKVVGTIKNGLKSNCEGKALGLQVFENEAKEYCAVITCGDNEDQMKLKSAEADILVMCISDEDFSKNKTV